MLGDEHPDTLRSVYNLGSLLQTQGRLDEAELNHRKALDLRRRVLGDEHPDTLSSAMLLASVLNARSQHLEAMELLQDTLPKADRALGKEDWRTAELRGMLGEEMVRLGEYEQAESNLLEGYEALEVTGRRQKLQAAAGRLVRLYEAWGKPEEAAEWRSMQEIPGE